MKHMGMKQEILLFNLQLFSEEENTDADHEEERLDNQDEENKEDFDEKLFSQKELDETVKKRVARERRKWQREQQGKSKEKDTDRTGESGKDNEETAIQELKEKAERAEELELKWMCLEHDVNKSCVDDVLALARVHMKKDADMDIEDAIDAVLKKYPQFKNVSSESEEEMPEKAWGKRQAGHPATKLSGVEKRFYELNPDLKK